MKYLWDDQNVLQEYDVATEARYTYNPQPYGDLVSQRRENEPSYYHFDGNLSTSALEVSTGEERYRWWTAVGFASFPDPENEIAILGHAGGLDLFVATFDGDRREVTRIADPMASGIGDGG